MEHKTEASYMAKQQKNRNELFGVPATSVKVTLERLVDRFYEWIGKENLKWFRHLRGLTGTYAPVLRLNHKRKGMPCYPVHLREGMQIRNWMRQQKECVGFDAHSYDNNWVKLVEITIDKYL